jgi:amino acid adenylation domain-containing protein
LFVARLFTRGPSEAYLLLIAHHIVLDALSFLHIAAELATLYPQFALGRPPAPPAVDRSYDAWVRWQRALLSGPEGERLRQNWATQLTAAPPALDLPNDRPRPAFQSQRGAVRPLRLSAALCAELRALAERERTTLFTVALAGFYALLHRLTQQRDLVVATRVAGRSSEALQSAVGYFVNTLPLRARIDDDSSTFLQLVRQLRRSVVEALDHQDLPFALIVEQARLPRDPSRAPLSQLMFQLQAHRGPADFAPTLQALSAGRGARIGALEIEQFPLEQRSAQCDLRIDLRDFGGEVAGILEYNSDLFDAERIARFSGAYLDLLRQFAEDPNATIASPAARASAAGRTQPLAAWNQTAVDYPDGRVQHAFERRAAEAPDSVALLFGSDTLAYGELNEQADRLARWLRERGMQRDVLVGVCMERSLELVIALLAIVKAGGAYVPLDPSYPSARLSYMLADAAPLLVIADDIAHGPLAESARRSTGLWLDRAGLRDIALDRRVPAHDLDHACAASDLAYVIYTSGSTGTPKGVAITHAGLWNRLYWMQEEYRLGPDDCVLQKTPYSFDVSVWEFFWPLMVGARLALARPEGHKDTRYLLSEIERQQVTTLHFVPSMLAAFLLEPELGAARSLRRVICSGEALPYASMRSCLERLPHAALHNLYGPTEASIDVTAWRCREHPRGIVPIGRPIANTQIHLLDEALKPVPVGEIGELYIAGVGLARGYHNRPELTAQRFVPNPFSDDPNARMYKTGDLARFAADGVIEYLGRNDDQIKLRGFRIELGEIEAVAVQHPSVRQCVVVARRLGEALRLEAFVVAMDDSFDARALERWLAARLPEYMVPRRFERLATLPLTPSGKTDRSALLALASAPAAPVRVAPRSDTERALAAVWQRVLGLADEPSIHDNYFELGGDSIRSLQVRALAREQGLELSVQALLAHQTIAELAQRLAAPAALAAEARLAPFALIAPAQRALLADCEDAFPVTQLQLGMLYHSRLTADSWAYLDCLSFEFGLARPWRADALQRALERLMRRHPMLRARFEMAAYDRPLTLIARQAPPPLVVHDLRGAAEQRAREARSRPRRCSCSPVRARNGTAWGSGCSVASRCFARPSRPATPRCASTPIGRCWTSSRAAIAAGRSARST